MNSDPVFINSALSATKCGHFRHFWERKIVLAVSSDTPKNLGDYRKLLIRLKDWEIRLKKTSLKKEAVEFWSNIIWTNERKIWKKGREFTVAHHLACEAQACMAVKVTGFFVQCILMMALLTKAVFIMRDLGLFRWRGWQTCTMQVRHEWNIVFCLDSIADVVYMKRLLHFLSITQPTVFSWH